MRRWIATLLSSFATCPEKQDSPCCMSFFFFQAEDGIRDYKVTGVQTCALPIYPNVREDSRPIGVEQRQSLPRFNRPEVRVTSCRVRARRAFQSVALLPGEIRLPGVERLRPQRLLRANKKQKNQSCAKSNHRISLSGFHSGSRVDSVPKKPRWQSSATCAARHRIGGKKKAVRWTCKSVASICPRQLAGFSGAMHRAARVCMRQTAARSQGRAVEPVVPGQLVFIPVGPGEAEKKASGGERSEERRVGEECRSRWGPDH